MEVFLSLRKATLKWKNICLKQQCFTREPLKVIATHFQSFPMKIHLIFRAAFQKQFRTK